MNAKGWVTDGNVKQMWRPERCEAIRRQISGMLFDCSFLSILASEIMSVRGLCGDRPSRPGDGLSFRRVGQALPFDCVSRNKRPTSAARLTDPSFEFLSRNRSYLQLQSAWLTDFFLSKFLPKTSPIYSSSRLWNSRSPRTSQAVQSD